ncbi:hypothetical protein FE251_06525 [Georgenia wutianyii]|uniref:VWFA domain-containing protein n=1 Tax=Georgenia wutianyii TaxID=2585135 RepID=A0ABX5VMB9_9MICO|nr:VWA domain-containing protein [Georgenia wutianyii]QDB79063.1 hypothetical protein FE251_06525 [Georgenia wutianyii]
MVRRAAGWWAAVACLLAAVVLGTGPAAAVGDISPVGSQSVSAVAACAAEADHLLAAVVVDESLSLRATDPDDLRVGAIDTALDSLERLAANSGGALDVQARLSVFGETSTELVGWGAVSGEHAEDLRSAVREELPSRDGARLTDYRRALGDAQTALDERAGEVGGTSCKLVLWLTDGKLDVDGRGDRPATEAARLELCEPGGTVDGIRADDVAVIAMGLMTSEGEGAATPVDRDRLQAIAEGSAGGESCGSVPVPADVTNGAFLNADDAGALARLFAHMGALLERFTSTGTAECPRDCTEGRLAIPVDPGLGGFRIVAQSSAGAAPMQLVAPDGSTSVLDAPTAEVGGAGVSVLTSSSLTTVDVRDVGADTGTWTLVTDPTATTVIDLYHFWGVTLTVEAPDGVVIGEPSRLRIVPRTADGSPVPLDVYGSAVMEATVDGEASDFRADGDGWLGEVTVPTDVAVSSLTVSGRATAVTTPGGIQLGPVTVEQVLSTQFPPSFPVIAPAELDFGRLDGATTARAVLTLTGAERGPTRACFGAGTVSAPEQAGAVRLGTATECVEIEADASVDVAVDLDAQEQADGRINGTLPVTLQGVDGDQIEAQVRVTGTMVRPVDVAAQLSLVAVLTGLALGLAYLSAVVARRLLGRFRLGPQTKYAEVPVRMTERGLERTDGATALLSSEEFRHLPVHGRVRSFQAGPVRHVVRYPWNPLAEPQALVTVPGRVPVTHVVKGRRGPWTRQTELPGSVGFVVATERPTTPEGDLRGTLVMVIDPGQQSVASLLPHRLAELARVPWAREVARARAAWEQVASGAAVTGASGTRPHLSQDGDGTTTPARPVPAGGGSAPPPRRDVPSVSAPPPRGRSDGPPPPRERVPENGRRRVGGQDAPPPPSPGRSGTPPPPPPRR